MSKLPLFAAVAAAVIALGVFAFVTDAPACAGTDSSTCNNCHVMDAQYENWYHAGHAKVTTCVECHRPHDNLIHYYVVSRVKEIQDQVFNTRIATENALIDAITAIKAASANPNADQSLLNRALHLHRDASFMWDFVSAENSMGFHNPEYSLKILANATDLARQAQMLASRSVKDPGLLVTDVYAGMEPKPAPAP